MEYKKYDCNSYNIHTIKTDKFKTVRMEIIFSNEVKKDKLPVYSFLSDILTDSSKYYKSRKEIAIKLEELYKTMFYGVSNKIGNLVTLNIVTEFIDPFYIKEKEYLENVLKFPFSIINNPNVLNSEFDITNFNVVKKRIKEELDSLKENANKQAMLNALKYMDSDSPSSFRVLGKLEDLNNITPSSLYKDYLEIFNHSNCDIFIIGNINMDEAVKIIKNNFKNRIIKLKKPNLLVHNKTRKKVLIKKEKSSFIQSSLVMIYNIKNIDSIKKNIDFYVFNYLLGGGLSSILYNKLRNENQLCYSVRSIYLKYDGLLVINVSLDNANIDKAIKLIKSSINEVTKGKFTNETLDDIKKNLIFSLKTGLDNNTSIINNYIFHVFDNLPLIDERINSLQKVEKEDIINCAKNLILNTIYVQESSDDK